MAVEEKALNLDEMFKQFSEIFKQYLTNPVFRQNMQLLMQVSIQEKDVQNMLYLAKFIQYEHAYRLSDERSYKPWKPKILNRNETMDLLFAPPTPPQTLPLHLLH